MALRHIPSKHDISTTIAPNRARLGPLETRHQELSVHIKFEENRNRKGLQTAARRSGQISKKDKKRLMRWQKWEASITGN